MEDAVTSITFSHEVPGLAQPLTVTAEYDAGDRSVGINPGWWLVWAMVPLAWVEISLGRPEPRFWPLDRDDYAAVFGPTALRVVEEAAADRASEPEQDRNYPEEEAV